MAKGTKPGSKLLDFIIQLWSSIILFIEHHLFQIMQFYLNYGAPSNFMSRHVFLTRLPEFLNQSRVHYGAEFSDWLRRVPWDWSLCGHHQGTRLWNCLDAKWLWRLIPRADLGGGAPGAPPPPPPPPPPPTTTTTTTTTKIFPNTIFLLRYCTSKGA